MEGITREYVEEVIAEVKEILSGLDIDGENTESLCARVCGRLALIVMMTETLAEREAAPPSIWLGTVAGMMLESEVETMQEYIEHEASKMARDN